LVEEGASGGTIGEMEHELVKNVFQVADKRIGSLMTYRQDIIWLDLRAEIATNREKILSYRQSLYPLCSHTIDRIEGIIYSKDLLHTNLDEQLSRLNQIKKEALFVPANSKAYVVLELFRDKRVYNGIVVDEYGGVVGMITMNDIFDALVKDLSQQTEVENMIVKREEGSYLIDAHLSFDEFLTYFSIPIIRKGSCMPDLIRWVVLLYISCKLFQRQGIALYGMNIILKL
jgi:putative hemolysin